MLDNLYSDIGNKIKRWAKWIFLVEAVCAIIGGIALLIEEEFLGGLAAIILGPIVAYVSTWLLYGFGEIVDKVCRLDSNLSVLAHPAIEEQNRIQQEAAEKAKREAIERAAADRARREALAEAAREAREAAKQEAAERAQREAEERAQREAAARAKQDSAERAQPVKEKTLAQKLEYALRYTTDDGMISYLQDIDDPLVAKILKEPAHLIRGLVQKALQEL
jgi:hypothetical protein